MFDAVVTGKKDTGLLTLRGDLTMQNSEKVKEALLDAVSRFKKIIVHMEKIEKIDFSCFQLFCAAHKTTVNQEKSMVIVPPAGKSPDFFKLLEYAGFYSHPGAGEERGATRGFIIREVE